MTPEEALIHAIQAEIDRLPPHFREGLDPRVMAADHLAGRPNEQMKDIRDYNRMGHPSFAPETDIQRHWQDHLLKGYEGFGWTPIEREALQWKESRDPRPYEYSHGGRMVADIEARARLFDSMEQAAKATGYQSPGVMGSHGFAPSFSPPVSDADAQRTQRELAARIYADQGDDKKANTFTYNPQIDKDTGHPIGFNGLGDGAFRQLNNPENWFGTFSTKMGPVLSDFWSQLGSSLLDGNANTSVADAAGDAATRSYAADSNRSFPWLAKDHGDWRKNDGLIHEMRQALTDSEGMSGDATLQAMLGGRRLPGFFHAIGSGGLSFVNGLGDMSSLGAGPGAVLTKGMAGMAGKTSIPLVGQYGRHIHRTIDNHLNSMKGATGAARAASYTRGEVGDELLDPVNVTQTASSLFGPPQETTMGPDEKRKKFLSGLIDEGDQRQKAIKNLERMNGELARPNKLPGIAGNISGY